MGRVIGYVMRMETSDETLAKAAQTGDRAAFAALLTRHYDRVFRLAFRLTGARDRAEDLTQDLCLKLPGKLASYRGGSKFTTWLYRVTVNAAHDARRRAETRAKAAEGWGDWEVNRRAADADRKDALDWLAEAMGALPLDLRDTLALTLDEDMTQAEAADVLGISEGTVAWRLSEVKKRLRAMENQEIAQ